MFDQTENIYGVVASTPLPRTVVDFLILDTSLLNPVLILWKELRFLSLLGVKVNLIIKRKLLVRK